VRLARWRVRLCELHFAQPLRTARGTFTTRTSALLELTDDDGVTGHGEAAPWPGFAGESAEAAALALREACSRLSGTDLEAVADPMGAAPPKGLQTAQAALHAALWDLSARRAGRPLAEHLGLRCGGCAGPPLAEVAVGRLLTATDPEALRAQAAQARAAGYRAVKLKLGAQPLATDVACARAVREAIGPEVRLRGDANGAWDRDAAVAALDALAEFGFEYVEQPLPAESLADLAMLRRRSPLRLAADESLVDAEHARRLLAAEAIDVAVLKPAFLGGPALALALAACARAAGVAVVFSHAMESAVGARHALHCAAAWGDRSAVHGLCTAGLFADDVAEPVGSVAGRAILSAAAGIGLVPP